MLVTRKTASNLLRQAKRNTRVRVEAIKRQIVGKIGKYMTSSLGPEQRIQMSAGHFPLNEKDKLYEPLLHGSVFIGA